MLTTMGVAFGTPGFIPPETLNDPAVFDARGDIYALGVVAYELITGQSLFERTTVFETCRKHLEVDPETPSVRLGRPVPPDPRGGGHGMPGEEPLCATPDGRRSR